MIRLPGYEIGKKIGQGGISEVFEALQTSDQRRLAFKILLEKYKTDRGLQARLLREAKIIGNLNHRNIVRIFKFGVMDDRFYTMMEYLGKGSLADFQQLTPRQRLKAMIQVCDGIGYVHSLGIVHRDLKPSNILFGDDGIPRLVDFGISLFANEDLTRLTQTNLIMGTLSYMSPEQQTNPSRVDARSDIYSLGAILYEIFTGKPPVGRFPDPCQVQPGFDADLERCILNCLQSDPGKRYPSIKTVQDRLLVLWEEGLFARGEEEPEGRFDDRMGYWLHRFTEGTPAQKAEARSMLANNVREKDLPRLLALCRDSGNTVRLALIPLLGQLGRPQALPFLIEHMSSPMLGREICQAMGAIGDARALPHLLRLIKKGAPHADAALIPLAKLGTPKELRAALPFLKSRHYAERKEALRALQWQPSKLYLRDLKRALKNESEQDLKQMITGLISAIQGS